MCRQSLHCEPRRGSSPKCQIFSDFLHILKDSTKTQIVRTLSLFLLLECEEAPFSMMPWEQKLIEWRHKEWHHLCPRRPQPGLHTVRTPARCGACCCLLWWIVDENGHTSCPTLCDSLFAMGLGCSCHQGWDLISHPGTQVGPHDWLWPVGR